MNVSSLGDAFQTCMVTIDKIEAAIEPLVGIVRKSRQEAQRQDRARISAPPRLCARPFGTFKRRTFPYEMPSQIKQDSDAGSRSVPEYALLCLESGLPQRPDDRDATVLANNRSMPIVPKADG